MEQKVKKIPERQCLGCGQHKPKRDMLRIVRDPENNISIDFTGKKSGRGAYICHDLKCFSKLRKSRRAEHIFECPIPADVYDRLEAEIRSETDK